MREVEDVTEAGPDADVVEHPPPNLVERRPHRLELAADDLVERERLVVEALVHLPVDLLVPEGQGDRVQEVLLGDRAVKIDDKGPPAQKCDVTPAGSWSAVPASGASNHEYA